MWHKNGVNKPHKKQRMETNKQTKNRIGQKRKERRKKKKERQMTMIRQIH